MAYLDPEQYKAYQKQYRAETRQWCKEHGFCIMCMKMKADAGYSTCLLCRMDKREREKQRVISDEQRSRHSEKRDERRARLKAAGICIDCGKRPSGTKTRCEICAARHNAKCMKVRHEKGGISNADRWNGQQCGRCLKPTENGAKYCPECLAKCPKGHGNKDNGFAKANALYWQEMNYRKAAKDACK